MRKSERRQGVGTSLGHGLRTRPWPKKKQTQSRNKDATGELKEELGEEHAERGLREISHLGGSQTRALLDLEKSWT